MINYEDDPEDDGISTFVLFAGAVLVGMMICRGLGLL